ncbi:MAG: hypothetical protein K0R16_158 [Nitrososphaeraceae archaeon]|nr:hypothetical protein [Nitrososphaeraceae archaeon]
MTILSLVAKESNYLTYIFNIILKRVAYWIIFIMISNIEGEQLVKLARKAVQKYLGEPVDINIDSLERFSQKTGVFVTLISVRSKEEQLRGCF